MMKKAMIATALMLAGGAVMAGEGYTDLVNSTGGSKSTVPMAKASIKGIAGEKAYNVSQQQFAAMLGLSKRNDNKSLAGDKPYILNRAKIQKMVDTLWETYMVLIRKIAGGKATPADREHLSRVYSLIMGYENLRFQRAMSEIEIPAKADALSELKAKKARADEIKQRTLSLINSGTYCSDELFELNKELKEIEPRIWFLETILR